METTSESNAFLQRRARERFPMVMRVRAAGADRGGWLQVSDASLESLGCLGERRYPLMSRMKVTLDAMGTPEAGSLEVEAIVFRCVPENGAWRLGLRLPHHNLPARDRFMHFMRSALSKRSLR